MGCNAIMCPCDNYYHCDDNGMISYVLFNTNIESYNAMNRIVEHHVDIMDDTYFYITQQLIALYNNMVDHYDDPIVQKWLRRNMEKFNSKEFNKLFEIYCNTIRRGQVSIYLVGFILWDMHQDYLWDDVDGEKDDNKITYTVKEGLQPYIRRLKQAIYEANEQSNIVSILSSLTVQKFNRTYTNKHFFDYMDDDFKLGVVL